MNLALLTHFTDREGVEWRRRGQPSLQGRALSRLLLDPGVRVLHDYLGEAREVPPAGRGQFGASIRQNMDASPFSNFYGADFKNDKRERLLVVHEDC